MLEDVWRAARWLVLLAFGAQSGCDCEATPPPLPEGEPESAVSRLVERARAGDCPGLRGLLAGELAQAMDEEGCDETLEHLGAFPVEQIGHARPDARVRGAFIVPVHVHGEPEAHHVRVEAHGDTWRVTQL